MAQRAAQPRYEDQPVEVMYGSNAYGNNTEVIANCSLQITWELGPRGRSAGQENTSKGAGNRSGVEQRQRSHIRQKDARMT